MSISEYSRQYIALHLSEDELYHTEQRHFEKYRRIEQLLCNCVREGDVDGLWELMKYENERSEGMFSRSAIGKARTQFIITVCLVSRCAVDGGLPVEISYPLSDIYLLKMEELKHPDQILNFLTNCVMDYTARVRDYKIKRNENLKYSIVIRRAQSIILSKISTPLTLASIAQQLNVTPDYLSRRFLQETGERLPHYIKRQRVEEACRLLSNTDSSLAQIAYRLGFSSQSLFNKQFKEITGTTPLKYRTP